VYSTAPEPLTFASTVSLAATVTPPLPDTLTAARLLASESP
jgi:hypothetical protein